MAKKKTLINLENIETVLLLLTAVIGFIIKDFTIMFYYWCAVTLIGTTFYIYEYKVKYKKHERRQLVALRLIRNRLRNFVIPFAFAYGLVYLIADYKSPIENSTMTLFSSILVLATISLIVAIIMVIRKNQQWTNKVKEYEKKSTSPITR